MNEKLPITSKFNQISSLVSHCSRTQITNIFIKHEAGLSFENKVAWCSRVSSILNLGSFYLFLLRGMYIVVINRDSARADRGQRLDKQAALRNKNSTQVKKG